jgi:hypothetical protein
LVVSAKSYIGAVVITDLYRLVRSQRERNCDPGAGAGLAHGGIRYAIQAGNAAEPEICVQRKPEPWLNIVAQVARLASYVALKVLHLPSNTRA